MRYSYGLKVPRGPSVSRRLASLCDGTSGLCRSPHRSALHCAQESVMEFATNLTVPPIVKS
jgi:hypothetical protein